MPGYVPAGGGGGVQVFTLTGAGFRCDRFRQNPLFLVRKFNNTMALNANLQLRSSLGVLGYHDRGEEIEKFCPLPQPIGLLDSQYTACPQTKK